MLSQEFNEAENRMLEALSRLEDFPMNSLFPGYFGTALKTSRSAFGTNQGTNEDNSQSDPHPEASIFRRQTTQNSGPQVGHDNRNKNDETRFSDKFKMATFRYWGLTMTSERALIIWSEGITPRKRITLTRQIPIQDIPLHWQFTKSKHMAKNVPPDNTFPMGEQSPQRQNSDAGNPINRLAESTAALHHNNDS